MKDTTFWPNEEQAQRLANTARMTADKSGLEDVASAKDLTPAAREKFSEGMNVPTPMVNNFGLSIIFDYVHHYSEGAGGLFSTAGDVGCFCQMLLDGGRGKAGAICPRMRCGKCRPFRPAELRSTIMRVTEWVCSSPRMTGRGRPPASFGHRGARKTNMWIDPKKSDRDGADDPEPRSPRRPTERAL
ncbi:MAG: serine hydrolase [Chthoniobacter sp.]